MLHDRNSEPLQLGLVADAGLHHDFRRVDCATRKHHLKASLNLLRLPSIRNFYAGGALSLEGNPSNKRFTKNREVRPIHVRKDVRAEYRLPLSISGTHIRDSSASVKFHHATIRILKRRNSDGTCPFNRGRSQRVGMGRRLDEDRSSRSTIFRIGRAVPVLDSAVYLQ